MHLTQLLVSMLASLDSYPSFKLYNSIKLSNTLDTCLTSYEKKPIILNSNIDYKTTFKSKFKRNFLQNYAEKNNVLYKQCSFDKFIENTLYLDTQDSLIYVDDFLVKNGRILTIYEEQILLNFPYTSNLIIFESENIKTIPYKDNNIIRHYPIVEFPEITKKDIVQYIYDFITARKYNSNLFLIDWKKFDIEYLDIDVLNKILYQVNFLIEFDICNNQSLSHDRMIAVMTQIIDGLIRDAH